MCEWLKMRTAQPYPKSTANKKTTTTWNEQRISGKKADIKIGKKYQVLLFLYYFFSLMERQVNFFIIFPLVQSITRKKDRDTTNDIGNGQDGWKIK